MPLKTIPVRVRLVEPGGAPMHFVKVTVTLSKFEVDEGIVVPKVIEATTNGDGEALMYLWPNDRGVRGSRYKVDFKNAADVTILKDLYILVPDGSSAVELDMSDLVPAAISLDDLPSDLVLTTTLVSEGTNKYFTESRVLSALLTGLSTTVGTAVNATHSVLQAIGFLQKQISDAVTSIGAKANSASPAFTGTPTGITKSHVGLSSVDNTADSAKPVSTTQQTALNLKANLAGPTFTGNVSVSSGLSVPNVASGVNFFQLNAGTAGNGPIAYAAGSDANINFAIASKALGVIRFLTNSGAQEQFRVGHTASAVNYAVVYGSATGAEPTLTVEGSDTNITLKLKAKGTGNVRVEAGVYTPPAQVAFSATPTINAALSNVFYMAPLTGAVTTSTISNPSDGQTISIRVPQDATGGRTFALPAGTKIDSDTTQETGANRVAWLVLTYVGTVNSVAVNRWEGAWGKVQA